MRVIGKPTGLAVMAICALMATALGASERPDSVYINGNVLTVDDQFSVVEAFAVSKDRFTHVGTSEELLKLSGGGVQVIDLEGKTVIPGLIDNHNHFVRGAQHWQNLVRLDGVTSRERALKMLRSKVSSLSEGEWLMALGGWHEDQFVDKPEGFTLAELDDLSPNSPVFIQAGYEHAFVNTAFFKYMNIPLVQTEAVDYPQHPVFGLPVPALVERDSSGQVTSKVGGGLFMVMQVGMQMPKIAHDASVKAARNAQAYYHSIGLTAVYDPAGALINEASYRALEELHSNGELTLRTYRTKWIQPHDEESLHEAVEVAKNSSPYFAGDDYYDLIALGEAMYLPLHDGSGHEPDFTDEDKRAVAMVLTAALERGIPLQIHAVNTSTLSFYLDHLEEMAGRYTVYPGQVTFTHAEGADDVVLNRLQALGATLQIRSAGVIRSKESLVKKAKKDHPDQPMLRLINDSGVLWGLGTDGTKAGQIKPMITLDWAVTGRALNGDQILPDSQLLSREEALIAHTRNNAQLVARGNLLGQIRPGFYADFVVLDKDYMSIPEEDIRTIKPLKTVVSGKVVHED